MIDIPTLIAELGAKFFAPFLVGMFAGWWATKSVYIGLATGAALGCLVWLLV